MLMNVVLEVEGCMEMPAQIQVHHEEIHERKESKTHLLFDIGRARSIENLRSSALASNELKINKKALEEKDKESKEKEHTTFSSFQHSYFFLIFLQFLVLMLFHSILISDTDTR